MIWPVRRAAVNVPKGRMDEVKGFYETVLGMKLFYTNVFESRAGVRSGEAPLLGLEGDLKNRLVVMQQGQSMTGMVGLHEILHPPMDLPAQPYGKPEGLPYPLIFSLDALDIRAVESKAEAYGCQILMPVRERQIPGREPALGLLFLDPLGIVIDLTEVPGLAGTGAVGVSSARAFTVPVPTGTMAECRRFCEQALGMKPYYDAIIGGDGERSGLGLGKHRAHWVIEQQGDSTEGMVGLIEYLEPCMDVRPMARTPEGLFPVVFVVIVDDMADVYERTKELSPEVICPPYVFEAPNRGHLIGATLLDPAGVLIDLTEFPSEAASLR